MEGKENGKPMYIQHTKVTNPFHLAWIQASLSDTQCKYVGYVPRTTDLSSGLEAKASALLALLFIDAF
jgi:hypothetical protein